mgnify:CR=1 FL=1
MFAYLCAVVWLSREKLKEALIREAEDKEIKEDLAAQVRKMKREARLQAALAAATTKKKKSKAKRVKR